MGGFSTQGSKLLGIRYPMFCWQCAQRLVWGFMNGCKTIKALWMTLVTPVIRVLFWWCLGVTDGRVCTQACALIICLFIIIREWGSAVETVCIGQIHGFKARVGIRLSSVALNLPALIRREDSETSTSGSVLYNPKSIWNRAEPQSLCLISLVATFLNRSEGNPLANLSAWAAARNQ